jgi:hypothetical protein
VSKDHALSSLDYWRLCDELNIIQAALLVVGEDPASPEDYPSGYEAAENAISKALRGGRIKGRLVPEYKYDLNGNSEPIDRSIDLRESTVDVTSLREWLASRGISSGFFFAREPSQPGYLNPEHPRYAPKLAAAVTAWQSFEELPVSGRSPKQALSKWLREHAAEFGLSDDEGNPNETGIEEVAKVANWQLGGGAPKTPGTPGG